MSGFFVMDDAGGSGNTGSGRVGKWMARAGDCVR